MNLLTKKTPWVAASLLAAASVFGQQSQNGRQQQKMFDQGHELPCGQMMPAYNAPARIDVRCPWDFYAQGSFTYWQAIQENMELGVVSDVTNLPLFANGLNGSVVNLDFDYKPGFKVGLGMNFEHDNWDALLQYTWFRGTNTTRTTLDSANTNITLWPMQLSGVNTTGISNSDVYFSGNEKWRLRMDLLDAELARSEYVGTRLSFRPFFGARAAWIRQTLTATYSNPTADDAAGVVRSATKRSNSWALGPRAGVQTNWMIGQGFRLIGNGSGDILYTRYTKLSFSENQTNTAGTATGTQALAVTQKKTGYLRTHLELEMGFGWGTYFDNNNWHVDLAATYGFQVFFDQNMFRHFNDDLNLANSMSPNGNLYVQGLTATVRFDF